MGQHSLPSLKLPTILQAQKFAHLYKRAIQLCLYVMQCLLVKWQYFAPWDENTLSG